MIKVKSCKLNFFVYTEAPIPYYVNASLCSGHSKPCIYIFFKLVFNSQEKDDNLYDLVDEDQYSDIVRQRREDDWIVGGNSQLIISTL